MACNHNSGSSLALDKKENLTPPLPPVQKVTDPKTLLIGYESLKKTSLATCIGCHKPGAIDQDTNKPLDDFSSLELIKDQIENILDEVTSDSMPRKEDGYKPLSQCYKDVLNKWYELELTETSDIKIGSLESCQ